VSISHGKQITDGSREARFFLEPISPLHRQYEALRAYFVEGLPSAEAARRFGYSPGAFRVLCHQFRRTEDLQERFFRQIRHGPQAAPARDPVRDLVVALRKKNLSVYDIQAELAQQGHSISINSLSVLLREEGFARLPRRRDEERPPSIKPERAEVADVRQLDLAPRSFRTPAAGLFLFVPLMRHLWTWRALPKRRSCLAPRWFPHRRPCAVCWP
jgi:transposase